MKQDVYNKTPGQMLCLYLMASYGYYIIGRPMIEDFEYDYLARRLLESWDDFEHQHKHFVTKDDLRAGTLFTLTAEDYPGVAIGGYEYWLKECAKYYSEN